MTGNAKTMQLRVADLRIHPTAQRAIVPAHVKKIRSALDLDKIGTISVVRYEIENPETGEVEVAWWVVDGQHRVRALLDEGLGDWMVNVVYHSDATDDKRASDLFLGLNNRRATHPYDRFMNEVRAGNPASTEILSIVESRGLKIESSSGDGKIAAVTALKNIYSKGGPAALANALDASIAAWGRTAAAMDGKVLEGLGMVFSTFNGQVDRAALAKKLAKYPGGASALLGNAKGRREWMKTSTVRSVGEIVVETYNRGRRSGALEGF